MYGVVTCVILFTGQLFLARLLGERCTRVAMWTVVVLAVVAMHLVVVDRGSLERLLYLCIVFMAGMKWVVYREWAHRQSQYEGRKVNKLSWWDWACFAVMWVGMDPQCFAMKRKSYVWKHHVYVGLGYVFFGVVLCGLGAYYQWNHVLLLFVPVSMIAHFGVLRLMTAFWLSRGVRARVLFKNPLGMRGFRDFWGRRWNLAYSEMMARAVKQPLVPVIGERWSVFAVFVMSGIFHEVAITLPVQTGYGVPTLFFIIHGGFTVLEKKDSMMRGLLCAVLLVLGLPYLFNQTFQDEVMLPCRDAIIMRGFIGLKN